MSEEASTSQQQPTESPTGPESGAGSSDAATGAATAKEQARAAKIERVRNMMKKSKSQGASHPVWTQGHYKVYVPHEFKEVAVCTLCVANQKPERAEVVFKDGSPTNLCNHLNTQHPGHQAAWKKVTEALAKRGSSSSGGEKQQSIEKFASKDTTSLDEKLCRFIVSANLPFSGSAYSCAVLLGTRKVCKTAGTTNKTKV